MKTERILDYVIAAWVVFVGIVYYGGYWLPSTIGAATGRLLVVYAAMVLLAATVGAIRFLRRQTPAPVAAESERPKGDTRKLTKRGR